MASLLRMTRVENFVPQDDLEDYVPQDDRKNNDPQDDRCGTIVTG